jgi:hypothetical protein
MRKFLVVAGLVMSSSAWAEGIDFWANFGETIVSNSGLGSDLCPSGTSSSLCATEVGGSPNNVSFTNGFHFGFSGGFNSGDHLGYEVGYLYNRTHLHFNDGSGAPDEGMAYHQVSFNALYYFTDPDSKYRPYATGGIGFTNYAPPGTSAAYGGGSTEFGINYGGGVKIKLTSRYGLRVDLREAMTPKPLGLPLASGWLRETEASVGFGIFF